MYEDNVLSLKAFIGFKNFVSKVKACGWGGGGGGGIILEFGSQVWCCHICWTLGSILKPNLKTIYLKTRGDF
jgi:hypothetical protein